jgi:hypothetical protein
MNRPTPTSPSHRFAVGPSLSTPRPERPLLCVTQKRARNARPGGGEGRGEVGRT